MAHRAHCRRAHCRRVWPNGQIVTRADTITTGDYYYTITISTLAKYREDYPAEVHYTWGVPVLQSSVVWHSSGWPTSTLEVPCRDDTPDITRVHSPPPSLCRHHLQPCATAPRNKTTIVYWFILDALKGGKNKRKITTLFCHNVQTCLLFCFRWLHLPGKTDKNNLKILLYSSKCTSSYCFYSPPLNTAAEYSTYLYNHLQL